MSGAWRTQRVEYCSIAFSINRMCLSIFVLQEPDSSNRVCCICSSTSRRTGSWSATIKLLCCRLTESSHTRRCC